MSTPDLPGPGAQPGSSGGDTETPGAQPGTVPPGPSGPDHGGGPGWAGPAGPPPGAPGEAPRRPSGTDGFFDAVRRVGIYRSDDRWIGGVASGVAERFGIDPLVVRGLLFVTFFLSGAGLVLYGAAWALLPERRDGRIHLQEAFRGNVDVALLGAAAFVVVGFSWGGGWWSWWDALHLGWLTGLFWVAAFVTVAVVAVSALTQRGPRGGQGTPPQAPPWPGGPGHGPGGPGHGPGAGPAQGPYAPGHGPTATPGAPAGGAPSDAPWGSAGPAYPSGPAYPGGPTTSGTPGGTPAGGAPTGTQDDAVWSAEASPYAASAPGVTAPLSPHAPYAPSPQGAPQPPLPPQPARAPRPPKPPRPRGPGATTTGIVVGLSLLLGALLLVLDRQGALPWPVFLTWAGLSGILAGLAIVVSGLRGRTSGGLGWLAVVLLVVALPASAWRTTPFTVFVDDSVRTVTDGTHRITDPDVAEQGFGVSFGDPRIDLSDLDLSDATAGSPVEVPVRLGAGDATVVVPDGVPVRAEVQVLAGNARWHVDGDRQEIGGVSTQPVTFDNDEVQAGDDPLLVLQVEVGAGQVTIEED
ncbi:MAG: PspC domain-containing protein [Cellulosimicrobium funkei]